LTEAHLTGRIFGDMLLELIAPQGLKGTAAAVQGVEFGGSGPFTAQITPLDSRGCHTSILSHRILACYEFLPRKHE
jgi:hypothetical protein